MLNRERRADAARPPPLTMSRDSPGKDRIPWTMLGSMNVRRRMPFRPVIRSTLCVNVFSFVERRVGSAVWFKVRPEFLKLSPTRPMLRLSIRTRSYENRDQLYVQISACHTILRSNHARSDTGSPYTAFRRVITCAFDASYNASLSSRKGTDGSSHLL